MKNKIHSVAVMLTIIATFAVSSCIKDEDIVTAPECAITSFSIGDIKTALTTKASDGSDSTYYKTIGGSGVFFNIDQIRKKIVNVDSLPNWTDLSRVVPTITSDGSVFVRQHSDSLFRYFYNGSDSIDFTHKVDFLVIGTDGMSNKTYTAEIFKSNTENDSLVWNPVGTTNLQVDGRHKSLYFNERVYVFAKTVNGTTVTSSSINSGGRSWTTPAEITCGGTALDYSSVIVFGDHLYALDTNGTLCKSTSGNRGTTWEKASEKRLVRILSADANYLYAYDGNAIVATNDLLNWTVNGTSDLDYLPETFISHSAYATRTNKSLQSVVFIGLCEGHRDNAVAWYKISSADAMSDQSWSYMQTEKGNEYVCPRLEGLNIVRYNRRLYAIGGKDLNDSESTPYKCIYESSDNGLSWHVLTKKVMLPQEVTGENVPATIVNDGTHLWLIQSGGKLWQGIIGGALND